MTIPVWLLDEINNELKDDDTYEWWLNATEPERETRHALLRIAEVEDADVGENVGAMGMSGGSP